MAPRKPVKTTVPDPASASSPKLAPFPGVIAAPATGDTRTARGAKRSVQEVNGAEAIEQGLELRERSKRAKTATNGAPQETAIKGSGKRETNSPAHGKERTAKLAKARKEEDAQKAGLATRQKEQGPPPRKTKSEQEKEVIKEEAAKEEDARIVKTEETVAQDEGGTDVPERNRRKRVRKSAKQEGEEKQQQEPAEISPPPPSKGRKAKDAAERQVKAEVAAAVRVEVNGTTTTTTPDSPRAVSPEPQAKPKRKRKTKEEKALEAMPLTHRTPIGTTVGQVRLHIGAHVSAAGGVHNAITNSVHIGGNAFALFLKSQRKWANPALKPEHVTSFRDACAEHKYAQGQHVVPHGSYLVNLAAKDEEKKAQAYESFLDDLKRCEELGITLYNFHPGNTNGEPRGEALARVAERLNEAHAATSTVVTVLENMAARGGNTIGGDFTDLRGIIDLVRDKKRVGVCLDTCHAFAAGYDLRSADAFKSTMREFDEIVGGEYLRAVHMNDSKGPFGSRKDLHYNIGLGFLGLRPFWNIVNDERFWGMPLVLETPIDSKNAEGKVVEDKAVWAREIKLLEGLVGMDAEGEEFKKMEKELADKGVKERERVQEIVDRKKLEREKEAEKKKNKAGGRAGKRKKMDEEEEAESSALSEAENDLD